MFNFISRLFGISNTRKSSPAESVTEETCNYSPVTGLRAGDLIDGPVMMDLVLKVEVRGGVVTVTTQRGQDTYTLHDTVEAKRYARHTRTGDYHLVTVR